MRIGINVPNELLQRVKQIRPELNVSQVCRDALEYRASVIERAGTQAALDGVDHYVDRLDQSVKKPLVEPDWVGLRFGGCAGLGKDRYTGVVEHFRR